jgi:hypothetical protein
MGQEHSTFIGAARQGDLAEVRKLLPSYLLNGRIFGSKGATGEELLNATPYVHIALIAAAADGREAVVAALLAAGAHPLFFVRKMPQFPELSGCTPLNAAVRNKQSQCAEQLQAAVGGEGEVCMVAEQGPIS